MRGPLLLLVGLMGVACTCGQSSGGESGCDRPYAYDASYGGYAAVGTGGTSGWTGGSGGTLEAGSCSPDAGVGFERTDAGCVASGCLFGLADCDPKVDGCETPLGSTSAHCGACEHACGTTPCTFGSCFDVLAWAWEPARTITAITADASGLYYAAGVIGDDQQQIYFAPGTSPTVPLTGGLPNVRELAVSGNRLVVMTSWSWHPDAIGNVEVYDLVKLASPTVVPFQGLTTLTVDATDVWVATVAPTAANADGGGLDGGDLDASQDASLDAADAADALSPTIGSLHRMPLGGGAPVVVWSGEGEPRALARGAQEIVLATRNPGRLIVIAVDTLQAVTVTEGAFEANRISVEGGAIYVADAQSNAVIRFFVGGGEPEVVATLTAAPYDVRFDGGELWYTVDDPGQLWRKSSGGPDLIAGLLQPRTPIALNAKHAFWVMPGVGVLALPR